MRKFVNKSCRQCDVIMENVSNNTQICDECRKENKRINIKKQNDKQLPKHSEEEYRENFLKVTIEPYTLTSKGFDEVSKIKLASYRGNFPGKTWREILSIYGKEDELHRYILDEYKEYYKRTGSHNIAEMCKNHKYLTYMIVKTFDINKIMNDCGFFKNGKRTEDDLLNNFIHIKEQLGRVPLFIEFKELSPIMISTYAQALNIKGTVYDNIVKFYVTDEEYNEYLIAKRERKTEIGRLNARPSAYSDEDLKNQFIKVFEWCKNEYGNYPSRRLFNKISKVDDRTYRKRLNKSWLDICQLYGYAIDKTSNKAEKMLLNLIKKITGANYEPQKTWKWLLGIYGFPLFCDGFYEDLNLVIEFDGRQHREPVLDFGGEERFIITQQNDEMKNKLIPQNGFKLIRISSEDPWYDINFVASLLIENNIPILQEHSQLA